MDYKNKKIAILGYGIEGQDAYKYLSAKGADVFVLDKNENVKNMPGGESVPNGKWKVGEGYLKELQNFDLVVRSPGVYRYLPEIVSAEKTGVLITSPIKIFFDECSARIIGVTGTKGKGTTSSLIYEILKADGHDVYLAGNIGKPYLELLSVMSHSSYVILEMSSFQLIDMDVSPHIAVVLNITADHLDWHKDIGEYINAKKNIVRHQNPEDFAVINADFEVPKSFENLGQGKKYYFSKFEKVKGSFVLDGEIFLSTNSEDEDIGPVSKLLLKGTHNWENICAAVCASFLAGAKLKSIVNAVFSFKGLEHRLELAGVVNGIKFYNDSFATGPQPVIAAIKSFSEPVTLILGGSDKGLDYSELAKEIANSKNVQNVILIGEIGSDIGEKIVLAGYKNLMIDLGHSTMKEIVKKSFQETTKGGVVILSPAAASFDMFKNYKDRGNQFKKAVLELKNG